MTPRLSLNHVTVKTTRLPEIFDLLAESGIQSIGLWREPVAKLGTELVLRGLRAAGLEVSSYTTGGFTVAPTTGGDPTAVDEVRRSLDEAAELGARTVVIRAGGLPAGSRDLENARRGVEDAIAELEPHAASSGVPLALEPLHPLFAADRGVVVTLDSALDIVESFSSNSVGVALDVYNSWWDPGLVAAIARAAGRIKVVQIADWRVPLEANPLHSRAMMGDGSIDFGPILSALQLGGYRGDFEVEIFNEKVWGADPRKVIMLAKARFETQISSLF